jgi:hypothetical protein
VARYREKDELDLAWNKIRRHLTREMDTVILDFREELLNDILVSGWQRYTAALDRNEIPELEETATEWIAQRVRSFMEPRVREALSGAVDDDTQA